MNICLQYFKVLLLTTSVSLISASNSLVAIKVISKNNNNEPNYFFLERNASMKKKFESFGRKTSCYICCEKDLKKKSPKKETFFSREKSIFGTKIWKPSMKKAVLEDLIQELKSPLSPLFTFKNDKESIKKAWEDIDKKKEEDAEYGKIAAEMFRTFSLELEDDEAYLSSDIELNSPSVTPFAPQNYFQEIEHDKELLTPDKKSRFLNVPAPSSPKQSLSNNEPTPTLSGLDVPFEDEQEVIRVEEHNTDHRKSNFFNSKNLPITFLVLLIIIYILI